MIDGATCYIPTSAKFIDDAKYLILDSEYFDQEDTGVLLEFIPGDTVEVVKHIFQDKTKGLLAKSLIKASDNSDKKLFDFLFKATKQTLPIEIDTRKNYLKEIRYVNERVLTGEFFYPTIIETIKKLEKL